MVLRKVGDLQEGDTFTRTFAGITYAETVLGWRVTADPAVIKLRTEVEPLHCLNAFAGEVSYALSRDALVNVLSGNGGTVDLYDQDADQDDPYDLARAAADVEGYDR